jgi:uncharacterized protein
MRSITVTGHGSATAVPDRAVLRLAAVHRAASMRDALAGAESARASVVAAAGDLVVSSANLNVWPAHDQEGRLVGFEARHAFTVTEADLPAAGALLARIAEETGDRVQVESVSLVVGDPSSARSEAREAAYADARARAEHLASLVGAVLGEVQSVSEGSGAAVPLGQEGVVALSAHVRLEPGETTIPAALTVTWAIT